METMFVDDACAQGWGEWKAGNAQRARDQMAADPTVAAQDIYVAAAAADESRVRELLDADAGLAVAPGGPRGWPPLLYAAFSVMHQGDATAGQRLLAIARMLLDVGASAASHTINPEEGCDGEDLTGVYGAVRVEHLAMVELLAAHGATDTWGNALYTAAHHDDPAYVRALLDAGANANGTNVLVQHASLRRSTCVRMLLEAGAAIDDAAWLAAIRNDLSGDLARLFLSRGVAPPAGAYRLAMRLGNSIAASMTPEALSPADAFLSACGRDEEPGAPPPLAPGEYDVLSKWASLDHAVALRRAGAAGVDVDHPGTDETPPLHDAAWWGATAAVAALIDAGASLEAKNGYGGVPLDNAVHGCFHAPRPRRHHEVVRLLLAAGAAPTAWSRAYAKEHNDPGLVDLLAGSPD